MIQRDRSPLQIAVDLSPDFELASLASNATDMCDIIFERHGLRPLDRVEAIVEGLSFELDLHRADAALLYRRNTRFDPVYLTGSELGGCSHIAVSLHNHIVTAAAMPPINRAMLKLARVLGEELRARAIIWAPARQVIGFDYFTELSTQYDQDSRFPLLLQINLRETAAGTVMTRGLDYFTGQELELGATPSMPHGELLRRIIRLAHFTLAKGRFQQEQRMPGLLPGERYSLRLSNNGDIARITVIPAPQLRELDTTQHAAA